MMMKQISHLYYAFIYTETKSTCINYARHTRLLYIEEMETNVQSFDIIAKS